MTLAYADCELSEAKRADGCTGAIERGEPLLNLLRQRRARVERLDVLAKVGRDVQEAPFFEALQQVGIGLVGKLVLAVGGWSAGVEVSVDEIQASRGRCRQGGGVSGACVAE